MCFRLRGTYGDADYHPDGGTYDCHPDGCTHGDAYGDSDGVTHGDADSHPDGGSDSSADFAADVIANVIAHAGMLQLFIIEFMSVKLRMDRQQLPGAGGAVYIRWFK